MLFNFFDDGVMIYEQIRKVELEHHGQDVLRRIDKDIASGWIEVYTDQKLKEQAIYRIFENNVKDKLFELNVNFLFHFFSFLFLSHSQLQRVRKKCKDER